jgi:large subunit ribosomal protein L24
VVDRKPCRIKYQFTEEGDKVRISKRSGRIIPKPIELLERKDFKLRSGYVGKFWLFMAALWAS